MRRGADIAERLMKFGLAVLRITQRLRRDVVSRHIAVQMFRATTGAGANYEEARAAESRGDFGHKVSIAAKEMREASYWISFLDRSGLLHEDMSNLVREAGELSAILGASARTARSNAESRG